MHLDRPVDVQLYGDRRGNRPIPGAVRRVRNGRDAGADAKRRFPFRAVFTITPDPADPQPTFKRVVGTKTLLAPLSGEADCGSQAFGDVDRFSLFVTHRYTAAIQTANGETCFDAGIGSIQMLLVGTPEGPFAEFREDFASTSGQAVCDDDDEEDDD